MAVSVRNAARLCPTKKLPGMVTKAEESIMYGSNVAVWFKVLRCSQLQKP